MYWRRALSPGFALPTIIVVSVILFAILAAVMSTVSSVRSRLTDQYRQSLTRDAAESGVAYATYCYASQAGTLDTTEWPRATSGAGQTLDSGDDCNGKPNTTLNCGTPSESSQCYVVKSGNVRTTFSVARTDFSGASYRLKSTGTSTLVRASTGTSSGQTQSSELMYNGYVQITGLTAGNDTSCAIQQGKLYCWGWNREGMTGVGGYQGVSSPPFPNVLEPVRVQGALAGLYVQDVASGIIHTCAIAGATPAPAAGNKLYCWGDNSEYQYGTNSTANSYVPMLATSISGYYFTSLSTSWHTCVIAQSGTNKKAYCWGKNDSLQAGENSTSNAAPVTTDPKTQPNTALRTGNATSTELNNVSYIEAVSSDMTCGINGSQAFCMGQNANGANGQGTTGADSARPKLIASLTSTTKVASNAGRVCALNASRLYCWGLNSGWRTDSGPNFTNSATASKTPISTPTRPHTSAAQNGLFNATISDFAVTDYSMCIIVSGSVWCSGYNDRGQLGQGTMTGPVSVEYPVVNNPVQNARATNTSQLVSANNAVKVGGALANEVAVRIVGGNNHFCVTTTLGDVYCWGANYYGQLGDGTTTDRSLPVRVKLPPPVVY